MTYATLTQLTYSVMRFCSYNFCMFIGALQIYVRYDMVWCVHQVWRLCVAACKAFFSEIRYDDLLMSTVWLCYFSLCSTLSV